MSQTIDVDPNHIVLNHEQIQEILPHRYPFLLVDRVVHFDDENYLVGQKNLTMNEQFFQGHFPRTPIMPGVLILEALAQAGGLLTHLKGFSTAISVLLGIKNAKFRKPALPGDLLHLHVFCQHVSSKGGKIHGKAMVGKQLAAEAEIAFAFVNKEQIGR